MLRSVLERRQETPANAQFSLGSVVVVWDSAFKIVSSMSLWFQGFVNFSFWHIFSFVSLETLGILTLCGPESY
jgi:hypothetical protein